MMSNINELIITELHCKAILTAASSPLGPLKLSTQPCQ